METLFIVSYGLAGTMMVATMAWGIYTVCTKSVTSQKHALFTTLSRATLSLWAGTALTEYAYALHAVSISLPYIA